MIRVRALAGSLAILLSSSSAYAQITVINAPPTVIGNGSSIGANTQLNVAAGGVVGNAFQANNGSVVNVSGGTVGDNLQASNGSVVNVSGGTIGAAFHASNGSEVTLSGGTLGDNFDASFGSIDVDINGGDFRLDGVLIGGLANAGDSKVVTVPHGALFTGVFSDGTPFAFTTADIDSFDGATLTLHRTALPAIGPATVDAAVAPVPLGIRNGQTITAGSGGVIGNSFNAGSGSTVKVQAGGIAGNNLEAVGAQVMISGGTVGAKMDAFMGSVVSISGGSVGDNFEVHQGATSSISGGTVGNTLIVNSGGMLNVSGGTVGSFLTINSNGQATISGGVVNGFVRVNTGGALNVGGGSTGSFLTAFNGGTVNVSAGNVGTNLSAQSGSVINISGGTIADDFSAAGGSTINVKGTAFFLDGTPIAGLIPNTPFLVTQRNMLLTGTLLDGSPLSFELATTDLAGHDYFSAAAILNVIKVGPTADFNHDGNVTSLDLSMWKGAFNFSAVGDADADGDSDGADLLAWQRELAGAAGIPGDFNHDTIVNQADLVAWRTAFGATAGGDGDLDGDSDGADLLVWQRHLGDHSLEILAGSVPEPATGQLAFASFAAWLSGRVQPRCRRRQAASSAQPSKLS